MVEIVSYSEALRDRIIDLILTIQRDEFGFDIRAEDQPDLLNIANFYQTGSGGFWVALSDGDVVGTIALRDIGNNQGALRKMFVKDTHRGGKTSVAFRLLERLCAVGNNRAREGPISWHDGEVRCRAPLLREEWVQPNCDGIATCGISSHAARYTVLPPSARIDGAQHPASLSEQLMGAVARR